MVTFIVSRCRAVINQNYGQKIIHSWKFRLLPNFVIDKFPVVKTLNFGPTISTQLKILKIGNFYCFQF